MGLPFWNGMRMSSISGIVRYGGTSEAAVDSRVRVNPTARWVRYGRAKRPSRNNAQVLLGPGASSLQTAHSSESGANGVPHVGQAATGGSMCRSGSAISFCIVENRSDILRTAGVMPSVWCQQAMRTGPSKSSIVPTPAWSRWGSDIDCMSGQASQSDSPGARASKRAEVSTSAPDTKCRF